MRGRTRRKGVNASVCRNELSVSPWAVIMSMKYSFLLCHCRIELSILTITKYEIKSSCPSSHNSLRGEVEMPLTARTLFTSKLFYQNG